jgi:hypothetical protein
MPRSIPYIYDIDVLVFDLETGSMHTTKARIETETPLTKATVYLYVKNFEYTARQLVSTDQETNLEKLRTGK